MNDNDPLVLLIIVVAVILVVRYLWTLHRYPLIACRRCGGSSMRTKWIFHPPSLWFRKVGGHCGLCGGKPWTERHP
ncbi:MAG: hypothetical protein M3R63_20575 [Actinomycetota bacterium]|nr:hypothetical protein [Actinomycetota bacterium]